MDKAYRLTLFGPPALEGPDGPVRLKRRKSMAALAYMAMAESPQTRERIATMLWPETDAAHALGSLRLALHEIGNATGLLELDRETIGFRHDQCLVDAREFRQIAEARQPDDVDGVDHLSRAVSLYNEEFLRGFGLRDSPEFDDWLFFTAESLQTRLATVLARLVEATTTTDTTEAIGYAQRLVQIEELNEDHHRALIDLYVTEGRFSAAIRQFERCREIIARELGDQPSGDLVELYESIRGKPDEIPEPTAQGSAYLRSSQLESMPGEEGSVQAGIPWWRRRGLLIAAAGILLTVGAGTTFGVVQSRRVPRIPTLLMLPFQYLPTGIAADEPQPGLSEAASRFVESELISGSRLQIRRASADGLGDRTLVDLGSLARREAASYVLDGAFLDSGGEFDVAVTLYSREDDASLYSATFEAIEDDYGVYLTVIAQEIREAVYESLAPRIVEYLQSAEALLNPYCEVSYLLQPYHMERSLDPAIQAQTYVTIMNELDDPYNCEGYFALADMFWNSALFGLLPPGNARTLLKAALDRGGQEIEGADKAVSEGILELIYNADLQAATGHFATAYELAPTEIASIRWWAISQHLAGNTETAVRLTDEMELYSPYDPTIPMLRSQFHYDAGNYEEALKHAQAGIAVNNMLLAGSLKGKALIQLGNYDEAIATLRDTSAIPGATLDTVAYLAVAHALSGNRREARELLATVVNTTNDDPSHFQSVALPAVVHAAMGNHDLALNALREGVGANDPMVWFLQYDPLFEPVALEVAELMPTVSLASNTIIQ